MRHKHRHFHGPGRHFRGPDDLAHHLHGRRHGGRHGRRLFDYGELRVLLLALIGEQPRHGYELIKLLEERFGGAYSPSPGVIYPTLAWLDDMGFAAIEAEDGGRKRYRITTEGEAFLTANRASADDLLARARAASGPADAPAPVVRAMQNLKLALRLRFRSGPVSREAAEQIAAAIDAAAQTVERTS